MVQEEYIIYDMVATIGAIGGTLGLFVGLSFLECGSSLVATGKRMFEAFNRHLIYKK